MQLFLNSSICSFEFFSIGKTKAPGVFISALGVGNTSENEEILNFQNVDKLNNLSKPTLIAS